MKINFESGRSMVEMLGTLAIIGVLSIGGIAGYSYAMDKHRANTIINEVNLRSIDLIAQANRSGEFSLSNWPTKIDGEYDIGLEIDATTNITEGGIFVSGLKQRVCDIIVDSLPEDVDFTVNNTASSTSCTETNKIVFYYNAIDDALGNSTQECAGTIVNGKCEPCSYPFSWNGTECKCPEGFEKDYYEGCRNSNDDSLLCPDGSYPAMGGVYMECSPCPEGATCKDGELTCPDEMVLIPYCGSNKCEPCPSSATYSAGECICNNSSETWYRERRNVCKSGRVPELPSCGTNPT